MMTDLAIVTLTGTLVEQPTRGETQSGTPTASFHIKRTRRWTGTTGQVCDAVEYIGIEAIGYPANSVRKYGCIGVEVLIVGALRVRTIPVEGGGFEQELYVEAQVIGYLSPRAILEAHGRRW